MEILRAKVVKRLLEKRVEAIRHRDTMPDDRVSLLGDSFGLAAGRVAVNERFKWGHVNKTMQLFSENFKLHEVHPSFFEAVRRVGSERLVGLFFVILFRPFSLPCFLRYQTRETVAPKLVREHVGDR